MREKIAKLKSADLQQWSFWTAIGADGIYILNIIICIYKFSKLKRSNPDELLERENGLTEYLFSHHMEQIVFMIGIVILTVACSFLFIAYIKESKKILKAIMIICLCTIVSFVALALLESFLIRFEIYPNSLYIFMQLAMIFYKFGLVASLIVSLIIFVVNKDYRGNALMLAGSVIWYAFGVVFIILGIILLVVSILGAIFGDHSDDSGHTLVEYDKYGKVLNSWRKE